MRSTILLFFAALSVQLFCDSFAAVFREPIRHVMATATLPADWEEQTASWTAAPPEDCGGEEGDPSSEEEEIVNVLPEESEESDISEDLRPVRSASDSDSSESAEAGETATDGGLAEEERAATDPQPEDSMSHEAEANDVIENEEVSTSNPETEEEERK